MIDKQNDAYQKYVDTQSTTPIEPFTSSDISESRVMPNPETKLVCYRNRLCKAIAALDSIRQPVVDLTSQLFGEYATTDAELAEENKPGEMGELGGVIKTLAKEIVALETAVNDLVNNFK